MTRKPPFGSAHAEVLAKFASAHWVGDSWSRHDGAALYENRYLTDLICQGLVRHGYLDEEFDGQHSRYTVNDKGLAKARQLRGAF